LQCVKGFGQNGSMGSEVVGVSEVGRLLGVSRQRVDQLVKAYEDFPTPIAELASGRIWRRRDIDAWLKAHPQRPPGRPKTAG
jgi:predicted DNA-binding transcriptional regulator AlpA